MKPKFLPPPHLPIAHIHCFDRLAIAIDCAAVPGPVTKLEAACRGGLTVIPQDIPIGVVTLAERFPEPGEGAAAAAPAAASPVPAASPAGGTAR